MTCKDTCEGKPKIAISECVYKIILPNKGKHYTYLKFKQSGDEHRSAFRQELNIQEEAIGDRQSREAPKATEKTTRRQCLVL